MGMLCARQNSIDLATGKRNLTRALVGHFDGKAFHAAFVKEFDFAAGSYAWQVFAADREAVAIGWLAASPDWDRASDFPTCMILPRPLYLSLDGRALLTPPVEAVVSLRQDPLGGQASVLDTSYALPKGRAEVLLTLAPPGARVAARQ